MRMAELVSVVEGREERLKARLRELVEVESPSEDKSGVDRAGELVGGAGQAASAEGVWGFGGGAVWAGAG
jgi:hypothetical protein